MDKKIRQKHLKSSHGSNVHTYPSVYSAMYVRELDVKIIKTAILPVIHETLEILKQSVFIFVNKTNDRIAIGETNRKHALFTIHTVRLC